MTMKTITDRKNTEAAAAILGELAALPAPEQFEDGQKLHRATFDEADQQKDQPDPGTPVQPLVEATVNGTDFQKTVEDNGDFQDEKIAELLDQIGEGLQADDATNFEKLTIARKYGPMVRELKEIAPHGTYKKKLTERFPKASYHKCRRWKFIAEHEAEVAAAIEKYPDAKWGPKKMIDFLKESLTQEPDDEIDWCAEDEDDCTGSIKDDCIESEPDVTDDGEPIDFGLKPDAMAKATEAAFKSAKSKKRNVTAENFQIEAEKLRSPRRPKDTTKPQSSTKPEDAPQAAAEPLPASQATDAEYQAIKASIAQFGCLQRVITDQNGNVISGRRRQRACQELGVHCPTEVITLPPELSEQLAFQLDFCRKHLSLDDLEERGEIGDGKTYKYPRVVTNTKKEEDRAREALRDLGDDAPARPLDLKRVEKLARTKNDAARRAARKLPPLLPDDSIQIIQGDFRTLQIDDNSVHLIMTDPPYDRGALPLWNDLATFAKRVLRPDGFLVTYTGTMFLPEVMAALASELSWVWQIAVIHKGGQDVVWARNVLNNYKPVLIFAKSDARLPKQISDVLDGTGKEKDFHEWQQSIGECMYFIDAFSKPGDLVVDPFGGGFTTAAACHQLGRRCLSSDIDADAVQVGLERLAQERQQKP